MGPCRRCIVRAGCTKDCKSLTAYLDLSSQIATFLAILTAGACVVAILLLTNYADRPTDASRIITVVVWSICAFINVCINMKHDEKMGELIIILFAPFITFVFFFLYLLAYIVKKHIRVQRV